MGPIRSENVKTLLLLQIAAKVFELVLNFFPDGPHNSTLGIFEILSFWIFNNFFFENSKFTIVAYGEIKNLNYLENERS